MMHLSIFTYIFRIWRIVYMFLENLSWLYFHIANIFSRKLNDIIWFCLSKSCYCSRLIAMREMHSINIGFNHVWKMTVAFTCRGLWFTSDEWSFRIINWKAWPYTIKSNVLKRAYILCQLNTSFLFPIIAATKLFFVIIQLSIISHEV